MEAFITLTERFHKCIWGKYSYSISLTPRAIDGMMLVFRVNKRSVVEPPFEEKYSVNNFADEDLAGAFLVCFNKFIEYIENLCQDDSKTVRENRELKEFLASLKNINNE